jgi:hypothetical protein
MSVLGHIPEAVLTTAERDFVDVKDKVVVDFVMDRHEQACEMTELASH